MNYKAKRDLKKLIAPLTLILVLIIITVVVLININETITLEGTVSNKTETSVYIITTDGSEWEVNNPKIKNNLLIGTKVLVQLDTLGTESIIDDEIINIEIIEKEEVK